MVLFCMWFLLSSHYENIFGYKFNGDLLSSRSSFLFGSHYWKCNFLIEQKRRNSSKHICPTTAYFSEEKEINGREMYQSNLFISKTSYDSSGRSLSFASLRLSGNFVVGETATGNVLLSHNSSIWYPTSYKLQSFWED